MRADVEKIMMFRNVMVNSLDDVLSTLPAIIPQSEEDEKLFKEGILSIRKLIYSLKNSENIREMSRYLDVEAIDKDFTMEDVKKLSSTIATNSRKNLTGIVDNVRNNIVDDDYEE